VGGGVGGSLDQAFGGAEMTREEIIRLAKEAGVSQHAVGLASERAWAAVERFAALVAAAEREACARMFDGEVWSYDYREIAAKIRARGKE
jgi:hypothetical protein